LASKRHGYAAQRCPAALEAALKLQMGCTKYHPKWQFFIGKRRDDLTMDLK
jgi:hypothetical protein